MTGYLARSGGTLQICIYGIDTGNLKSANELSFAPSGFFSFGGYQMGKYAVEQLGYKTANVLSQEDVGAREIVDGFAKGFTEAGGTLLNTVYAPIDTMDFSPYLQKLQGADCTYWWVIAPSAPGFIKQYKDYGLTAPLMTPMASNLTEPAMQDLGRTIALDLVGSDYYSPQVDTPMNRQFVADYLELYPGEYPNMNAYRRVARGQSVPGRGQEDQRRHDALEAHRGDVDHDARHARRPCTMSPYQTALHRHGQLLHHEDAEGRSRRQDRLGARRHGRAEAARRPEMTGTRATREAPSQARPLPASSQQDCMLPDSAAVEGSAAP